MYFSPILRIFDKIRKIKRIWSQQQYQQWPNICLHFRVNAIFIGYFHSTILALWYIFEQLKLTVKFSTSYILEYKLLLQYSNQMHIIYFYIHFSPNLSYMLRCVYMPSSGITSSTCSKLSGYYIRCAIKYKHISIQYILYLRVIKYKIYFILYNTSSVITS
jgi:hypothetical protein